MRLTIRLKLLLAIGVPFLALAALALTLDHWRQRATAFETAQVQLAGIAARGAAELDGFFGAAANVPRTIAGMVGAGGIPGDDEAFGALRAILEDHPEFYGACFAVAPDALVGVPTRDGPRLGAPPGRTRFAPYVCREGAGLRSMDLSTGYDYTEPKWEWYDKPFRSGAPWWTEPYFDEGAGNAAMVTYSAPVRLGGRIVAIATVDVRLEDIQRRMTLPAELASARWLILSRSGTFVSVLEPELLLKSTIFDLASRRARPALDAMGRRMVAGERGSARFPGFEAGEPRLASFEPIPSTGWSFALHVPESTILGPVYTQLQERLAAAALVSLVLLAVVLAAAFWISRPIPRLAAAVRELSTGKLDARVRGVDTRDEFGELAAGFNRMVEDLNRHVDRLTAETASRERVESELRVAREIQMSLLPSTFPAFPDHPEFDLHAINAAARSIAGDFFDFELVAPDRLYFVIADVSGKGIPAAMFMAVTRTLLRNLNRTVDSPARILDGVNRVLIPENRRMMFVTLLLGFYDLRTGLIRYANAGHPPARLLRADGTLRSFGEDSGALLGVLPGEAWHDGQDTLGPGDAIVLFTDGVSEAGMGDKPLYGVARLDKILRTHPGKAARGIAEAVVRDVEEYQAGHLTDDVTLLVLRRNT